MVSIAELPTLRGYLEEVGGKTGETGLAVDLFCEEAKASGVDPKEIKDVRAKLAMFKQNIRILDEAADMLSAKAQMKIVENFEVAIPWNVAEEGFLQIVSEYYRGMDMTYGGFDGSSHVFYSPDRRKHLFIYGYGVVGGKSCFAVTINEAQNRAL